MGSRSRPYSAFAPARRAFPFFYAFGGAAALLFPNTSYPSSLTPAMDKSAAAASLVDDKVNGKRGRDMGAGAGDDCLEKRKKVDEQAAAAAPSKSRAEVDEGGQGQAGRLHFTGGEGGLD